jgi:hypothetical protein
MTFPPEESTGRGIECQWTGNLLGKSFIHWEDNTIGIGLCSLLNISPQDSRRITSEASINVGITFDVGSTYGGLEMFSSQCGL